MLNVRYILLLFAVSALITGCIKKNIPQKHKTTDESQQLIQWNKKMVDYYQRVIKQYIRQKGWQMDSTGLGMWYEIYDSTDGQKPADGDIVTVEYKIMLLNGQICYSSDSLGLKTFTVNNSPVTRAMNEAVQLMPMGSKARFIVPPYLAYGLTGDQNRIPPNAILIYDLHLVNIKRNCKQNSN